MLILNADSQSVPGESLSVPHSASVLVLLAGFLNSVSKCGVRKLIHVIPATVSTSAEIL
jgi:hypothetical protein